MALGVAFSMVISCTRHKPLPCDCCAIDLVQAAVSMPFITFSSPFPQSLSPSVSSSHRHRGCLAHCSPSVLVQVLHYVSCCIRHRIDPFIVPCCAA